MRQTHFSTRENDFGCYTDNWGVIDDVECVGCMLAPGGILENVLEILEAPTGVQTEVVALEGGQRVVVNAAPRISDVVIEGDVLQLSLKYFAGETAQTTVMPVAEPTQIEVDGTALAKHSALTDVPEGWTYAPDIGCLTLKLKFSERPRPVRITKATPIVPE